MRRRSLVLGAGMMPLAVGRAARAQGAPGRVTVVTSFSRDVTDPFKRAFERAYPGTMLEVQNRNTNAGVKFVALGFDIRESDFPLRIAWPIFLLNVINDFVEEDVSYISSFKTGDVWHIPAPTSAETATLELPDGSKRAVPIKDGRAVFLGQQAGFQSEDVGR